MASLRRPAPSISRLFRALLIAALLLVPTIAARSQTRPSNDAQAPGKDVLLSAAPAWDLDHDGIYTCDEWKQYARRLFNMAASTHDGFIGRQEFEVVRRADAIFADADFDDFDANRDGRLSESEFVDKPSPFFARYDRNHDCRVTPDELKGGPPAANQPRAGRGRH